MTETPNGHGATETATADNASQPRARTSAMRERMEGRVSRYAGSCNIKSVDGFREMHRLVSGSDGWKAGRSGEKTNATTWNWHDAEIRAAFTNLVLGNSEYHLFNHRG